MTSTSSVTKKQISFAQRPEIQGTCLIFTEPEKIVIDTCEKYARRWAQKEDVEVDTLSERVKSIADVLKHRIRLLKQSANTKHESIFCNLEIVREIFRLHENFVIVSTDKASNTYTFVCKQYYVSILIEELEINSLHGNLTYNLTGFLHQKCWTTIICPHFLWKRYKWRRTQFAIYL